VGGACGTYGRKVKHKPEREGQFGSLESKLENVKMNLKGIEWEGADLIHLLQDSD
jgi:hypothetical protein